MEEGNSVFYQSRRENETKQKKKFGSVLQEKSLKGKDAEVRTTTAAAAANTPAAEVAVTASTAVKKQLTSERTMEQMEYFMEHIMQRHVQPLRLQYRENSFFLSTDKQYIFALVTETMKNPDVVLQHRKNKDRAVKKKTFLKQVGVHGTKAPCYCVTVIFNIEDNKIITAFPTL